VLFGHCAAKEKMPQNKMTIGKLLAYAAPAAPIAALGLPITVYLPPFYESLGLGLGTVGAIFMLSRFWDVFTDPVLGIVSDHYPSRWGRRRHWIVLSIPILLLSVYMVFLPPGEVSSLYLGIWMFVLYLGYTLASLSHMSWGTELSDDYHQRSTIHGAREVALIFGMFSVLTLPAIIEIFPGLFGFEEGKAIPLTTKVGSMGIYIMVLFPITVAIAMAFVGERKAPKPEKIHWGDTLSALWKDKMLQRILIMDLLVGAAPGITGALYLYFYDSYMQVGEYSSILLLSYFIAGCLSVPLWIKLSYMIGKHRAFSFAQIYGGLALPIVFFVPKGDFMWAFISTSLYGLAYGAGPFLMRAMMSDLTDKDNFENGTQRTGLYFSLLTLTNKIGGAVAVGAGYIALEMMGYIPRGENTPEVVEQLSLLYVGVPAIVMVSVAVIMWNYPLGMKEHKELRRKIDERDSLIAKKQSSEGDSEQTAL
jgi:GPH family glycoside/pentoside/hexuronide:cation symporter